MGIISLIVIVLVVGGGLLALSRWDRRVRRRGSTFRSASNISASERDRERNARAAETMIVNPNPDWDGAP